MGSLGRLTYAPAPGLAGPPGSLFGFQRIRVLICFSVPSTLGARPHDVISAVRGADVKVCAMKEEFGACLPFTPRWVRAAGKPFEKAKPLQVGVKTFC